MSNIPIKNVWLLMLYASELAPVLSSVNTNFDYGRDNLPNLIAEYLLKTVEKRLERNLTYGYMHEKSELSRVRGRINLLTTERKMSLLRGKVDCTYENLTINTLKNRLILSALERVATQITGAPELKKKLLMLASRLERMGVSRTRLSRSEINSIRAARNEGEDNDVVIASKLVFDNRLPNTQKDGLFSYLPERDEVWLRSLFEKAVRGFYRFHLRNLGWDVGVKKLNWHINYIDDGLDELLPSMKTDMILDNKNENRRVVIDTKFTSILKPGQFGSDTLRSGYLYQMYAYLMSQQDSSDPLDQNSSGILLHPEIGGSIDKSVVIQKKTIRFMTVNLAGTLEEMKRQLLSATNQTPIFR